MASLSDFFDNCQFAKEHTIATTLNLGNLNNAIDPIFREQNFDQLTPAEYAILVPSLRLATRILRSDQMRRKLRTILLRRHGLIHLNETCRNDRLCRYTDADSQSRALTPQDRNALNTALAEFVNYVTFKPHKKAETKGAFTNRTARITTSTRFQGNRTRIWYSRTALSKLHKATAANTDPPLILFYRFQFAVEFIHELCHGLQNAREPRIRSAHSNFQSLPFFARHQVSEVGFAVEKATFGGHLGRVYKGGTQQTGLRVHRLPDDTLSKLVGIPVRWEYPTTWVEKEYQGDATTHPDGDMAFWVRDGWENGRREKDVAWRLYPHDMQAFFTTAFWQNPPAAPWHEASRSVGTIWVSNDSGAPDLHLDWNTKARGDSYWYVPRGFRKARGLPEMRG